MKPYIFAGSPLDRAANCRRDGDWIGRRLAAPEARFVPLWRLKPLIEPGPAPAIRWLSRGQVAEVLEAGAAPIFLGLNGSAGHFAIEVPDLGDETEPAFADLGKYIDLRTIAPQLGGREPAILAQARALVDWHARHRFCACCGDLTRSIDGGAARQCDSQACGAQHFPRTDPVVIMVVSRGDRCLLGRSAHFPANFFSALAGFVEVGETIEEAVRREVGEEAGIEVGAVRYHSCQPWPFPSSLMIGCLAEALSDEITIDPKELAEARWLERDLIRRLVAGGHDDQIMLPPPMAIARHLIEAWAS